MKNLLNDISRRDFGRLELITYLACLIERTPVYGRATIVGLDGIDLSGKSTMSTELAEVMSRRGRSVHVIHLDDFVTPRSTRQKRGEWSAEGFFYDFFDYQGLIQMLLTPLSLGLDVDCVIPKLDFLTDVYDSTVRYGLNSSSTAIVEGLFLARSELSKFFDVMIRLTIDPELVMERALLRDVPQFGDAAAVQKGYEAQSIPAQHLYSIQCHPDERADVIVNNSLPSSPWLIKGPELPMEIESTLTKVEGRAADA